MPAAPCLDAPEVVLCPPANGRWPVRVTDAPGCSTMYFRDPTEAWRSADFNARRLNVRVTQAALEDAA